MPSFKNSTAYFGELLKYCSGARRNCLDRSINCQTVCAPHCSCVRWLFIQYWVSAGPKATHIKASALPAETSGAGVNSETPVYLAFVTSILCDTHLFDDWVDVTTSIMG